jgi:hypothetical protein
VQPYIGQSLSKQKADIPVADSLFFSARPWDSAQKEIPSMDWVIAKCIGDFASSDAGEAIAKLRARQQSW